MRYLVIIIFLLLVGCNSSKHTHPVLFMYEADYEHQAIMTVDAVNDEQEAKIIAKAFLSTCYKDLEVDFNNYKSFTAELVNKNTIWKLKMEREEQMDGDFQNKYPKVLYLVYIRKSDGALLYRKREAGEWLGSTDVEERFGIQN